MDKLILDCYSDCCSAPSNSDHMICSDCKEHCDIYYEEEYISPQIKEWSNNIKKKLK